MFLFLGVIFDEIVRLIKKFYNNKKEEKHFKEGIKLMHKPQRGVY